MVKMFKAVICLVLICVGTSTVSKKASSQSHSVVYTFKWHDCPSTYDNPDFSSIYFDASRFTREGVGCHSLSGSTYPDQVDGAYGTRSWPTDNVVDVGRYVGFTLTAPEGQEIKISPGHRLKFLLEGMTSLKIDAVNDAGISTELYQQDADTSRFWRRIDVPIQQEIQSKQLEFRFLAYNTNQIIGFDSVSVSFDVITSVGTESIEAPLTQRHCSIDALYPSPTRSTVSLNLFLHRHSRVKVSVSDLTGRIVYQASSEHDLPGIALIILDLSNLPAGIYGVTAQCDQFKSHASVIKL